MTVASPSPVPTLISLPSILLLAAVVKRQHQRRIWGLDLEVCP